MYTQEIVCTVLFECPSLGIKDIHTFRMTSRSASLNSLTFENNLVCQSRTASYLHEHVF